MTKLLLKLGILVLLSLSATFLTPNRHSIPHEPIAKNTSPDLTNLNILKQAFENQHSNFQVKQAGQIVKILRDDNHGLKHQRFVVQLSSGQKLLIAHNVDLAPKVEGLKEGGLISFYGEYEWNNKGGVIHWTHQDPRRSHPDGWLLYENRKYD